MGHQREQPRTHPTRIKPFPKETREMACSEDKEIRECIRVHKITDEIKHVISLISLPFGRAITIVEKPSIARKPVVYDALGVLDT